MLTRGGYSKKLEYRLGFWPTLPAKKKKCKRIWVQAVSVGELLSIQKILISLIKELTHFFLNFPLLSTTVVEPNFNTIIFEFLTNIFN